MQRYGDNHINSPVLPTETANQPFSERAGDLWSVFVFESVDGISQRASVEAGAGNRCQWRNVTQRQIIGQVLNFLLAKSAPAGIYPPAASASRWKKNLDACRQPAAYLALKRQKPRFPGFWRKF
jgi:hypothetical protein